MQKPCHASTSQVGDSRELSAEAWQAGARPLSYFCLPSCFRCGLGPDLPRLAASSPLQVRLTARISPRRPGTSERRAEIRVTPLGRWLTGRLADIGVPTRVPWSEIGMISRQPYQADQRAVVPSWRLAITPAAADAELFSGSLVSLRWRRRDLRPGLPGIVVISCPCPGAAVRQWQAGPNMRTTPSRRLNHLAGAENGDFLICAIETSRRSSSGPPSSLMRLPAVRLPNCTSGSSFTAPTLVVAGRRCRRRLPAGHQLVGSRLDFSDSAARTTAVLEQCAFHCRHRRCYTFAVRPESGNIADPPPFCPKVAGLYFQRPQAAYRERLESEGCSLVDLGSRWRTPAEGRMAVVTSRCPTGPVPSIL